MKITFSFLKNPIHLLACGLGSGLSPKAPGTLGTVMAFCLWYPLSYLPPMIYIVFLFIASILGVFLCHYTSNSLKVMDHPAIVWDEFCGYWLTMCWVPFSVEWGLIGFILFRLFDIFKPWPINLSERLPKGWGIMADDLIAGLFSSIILNLLIFLI